MFIVGILGCFVFGSGAAAVYVSVRELCARGRRRDL